MQLRFLAVIVLSLGLMTCRAGAQQAREITFHDAADLSAWKTTGDVSIDTADGRPVQSGGSQAGGSLKIGPGAKATLLLRPTDGAGTVEMWVKDDLTKSPNPKQASAGPRWGLVQADGHMLLMGVLYAPYLAGDTTYATSDTDGTAPLEAVQYSALGRVAGWHKWTFDFDDAKGLSITLDDQKKARFDWNISAMNGFAGIALLGDAGKNGVQNSAQTLWVSDVTVTLGGEMKAKRIVPSPATPQADPAPERKVELLDGIAMPV